MPTAEEYLRQDIGAMLTGLVFQNALLKAEVDRLKAEANPERERDHVPRER